MSWQLLKVATFDDLEPTGFDLGDQFLLGISTFMVKPDIPFAPEEWVGRDCEHTIPRRGQDSVEFTEHVLIIVHVLNRIETENHIE